MQASIDTDLSQQCQSVAGEHLDIGKQCDELLQDQNDLATHIEAHTGEELYQCNQCRKTFSKKGELDLHFKTLHTVEKIYNCDRCENNYKRKYDLGRRAKTHTREN